MISYDAPANHVSCADKNCTIASIFEKPNSLKFEILFGNYCNRTPQVNTEKSILNAFDYMFAPGTIFGFSYESNGSEFKNFNHIFVLRACFPGEVGSIIPGIAPGAEILAQTLTNVGSARLKVILEKLQKNKISLEDLSISHYRRLYHLLELKINTDFFVGELIDQQAYL
jgi:hypothetical protein